MKYLFRALTILCFLAGCTGLFIYSRDNSRLDAEVKRLEAELGRMAIVDLELVYVAEIETPYVPPEVASHLEAIWQFRCYLPPDYDFMQMRGSGRVTDDGLYLNGGFGSNWGSPQAEAIHNLLTVSCQKDGKSLRLFCSFSGSGGTSMWNEIDPDRFDTLVVKKLVSSEQGPRSFPKDVILPLLKIYDPSTAEQAKNGDETLTTYSGGLILLCPKSREQALEQLRRGQTPSDFNPSWIATEVRDE